jgi:hypothetical protein
MMGLRCLGVCFAHGINERIRVNEFYNGLTYWDVLIKALAGWAAPAAAQP